MNANSWLFALAGIVLGAVLTQLNSILSDWRAERKQDQAVLDEERAVFSGAFSICNFVAERLNFWDARRQVSSLERLQIAQFYLNRLIDRSPRSSDRLMIALVDLGLRIESLLFVIGKAPGNKVEEVAPEEAEIDLVVDELAAALESTQLILGDPLAIASIEELFDLGVLTQDSTTNEDEKK